MAEWANWFVVCFGVKKFLDFKDAEGKIIKQQTNVHEHDFGKTPTASVAKHMEWLLDNHFNWLVCGHQAESKIVLMITGFNDFLRYSSFWILQMRGLEKENINLSWLICFKFFALKFRSANLILFQIVVLIVLFTYVGQNRRLLHFIPSFKF